MLPTVSTFLPPGAILPGIAFEVPLLGDNDTTHPASVRMYHRVLPGLILAKANEGIAKLRLEHQYGRSVPLTVAVSPVSVADVMRHPDNAHHYAAPNGHPAPWDHYADRVGFTWSWDHGDDVARITQLPHSGQLVVFGPPVMPPT